MNIKYNLPKLIEIIDDVHMVLGVSLSVLDADYRALYRKEKTDDDFCTRIISTPEGMYKCQCSDRSIIDCYKREGKPVSHVCHAGILDTVVPLVKDGIIAGYIFIGRIRPSEHPNGIVDRLSWLGDSAEDIHARYYRLAYYSKEQLECIKHLMSHILFDSAIEIVHDTVAEKAEEYIKAHISEDLSVDKLCKGLFISKNRLYAEFRKYFGMTVNEYICDYRIELAKGMLKKNDKSISAISSAVGMDNYAYFCKLFKSKTGMSPTEFRKLNSN